MPSLHFADPKNELTENSPRFPGTSLVICLHGVLARIRARELMAAYPEIFPGLVRVADRGHAGFFDYVETDGLAVVESATNQGFLHRASVWIDKGSKRHGIPLPAKGSWEKLRGPVVDGDEIEMMVMTLRAASMLVDHPKYNDELRALTGRVITESMDRIRVLDPSGKVEQEMKDLGYLAG